MAVTLVLLAGCPGVFAPPSPDITPEAAPFLNAVRHRNQGLSGLKGLGKIRFSARGMVADAAWILSLPGKIRLAVLGPAGQPLQTLSADGKKLISIDHHQGKRRGWPVSDPELDGMLRIPIRLSDLVFLLAGKIPVTGFSSAALVSGPDERILVLKNWRNVVRQKIFFRDGRITRIDRMRNDGRFAWRAFLDAPVSTGGYEFSSFQLESAQGRFEMAFRRCVPDPDIDPAAFTPDKL